MPIILLSKYSLIGAEGGKNPVRKSRAHEGNIWRNGLGCSAGPGYTCGILIAGLCLSHVPGNWLPEVFIIESNTWK